MAQGSGEAGGHGGMGEGEGERQRRFATSYFCLLTSAFLLLPSGLLAAQRSYQRCAKR
jgi:hypothetical protein